MKTALKVSAILLLMCLSACSGNIGRCGRLDIYIPAGINIEENDIRARLARIPIEKSSSLVLRITIYGYSSGPEILSITDGEKFTSSVGRAWIKGLVQVQKGEEIIRADFIEVQANNREELLNNFALKVTEIYCKQM